MIAPALTLGRHTFSARSIVLHVLVPAAFAGAYLVSGDMQLAIEAMVVASVASLLLGVALERRILVLPLVLGCVGIATALLAASLHNLDILKLKATVFHALIGSTLLGLAAFRIDTFPRLFGEGILTARGWRRLTILFGILSLATALANLVIWRTQPERVWVFFHFPGSPLIHLAVLSTQIGLLKRDHAAARLTD